MLNGPRRAEKPILAGNPLEAAMNELKPSMKSNLIRNGLLAVCWCLGIAAAFAQNKPAALSATFLDGKVWLLGGPQKTEATNKIEFPGGISINTNGVFTVKGGKERQLKTGQVLASDGMLTSPDGSVVPVQDHLAALNARVNLVKDGEATPLASQYVFPDGSRVQPGGEIFLPNGGIRRMLDGQIAKLDGVSLPATDTASLQGGKVVLFKDGDTMVLRPAQTMMMSDGSRVSGDGKVIRADGSTTTLKEGEILKMSGVVAPKKY
jgi:hypothetical protein